MKRSDWMYSKNATDAKNSQRKCFVSFVIRFAPFVLNEFVLLAVRQFELYFGGAKTDLANILRVPCDH
jgi:hypothetical protein